VTRSSARDSSNIKKKYSMDKKSNLTELIISKKDIKFVTVNMLNMNLKIIKLSSNKISFLPDEICEIKNLQELYVDKNCISKLPSDIGKIRNLKILNAS
jgi:Leucine-rich repeat (LRR) protein